MGSLPGTAARPNGASDDADPVGTVETELLSLVRNLETLGRRSDLYRQVDRAGYLALRTLDRLGPVATNALADALHLDASTITRQVTTLVAGGLVERRPNPVDARSSDLAVTAQGRRVMRDVGQARHQVLARLFADWSEAERHHLARSLTKLNGSLGERVAELRSAVDRTPRP
jgi:DNA-binding MarR family transcriptional regulator